VKSSLGRLRATNDSATAPINRTKPQISNTLLSRMKEVWWQVPCPPLLDGHARSDQLIVNNLFLCPPKWADIAPGALE
jgi:hypothetical protein